MLIVEKLWDFGIGKWQSTSQKVSINVGLLFSVSRFHIFSGKSKTNTHENICCRREQKPKNQGNKKRHMWTGALKSKVNNSTTAWQDAAESSAGINHSRFDKHFCTWELRYDFSFSQAVTLMILQGRWRFWDRWFSHHPAVNFSARSLPRLFERLYLQLLPTYSPSPPRS